MALDGRLTESYASRLAVSRLGVDDSSGGDTTPAADGETVDLDLPVSYAAELQTIDDLFASLGAT
jgi:hypothetical protein